MKNHQQFFDTYERMENEQERLAFLRGYLMGLPPEEMLLFMMSNFDTGFAAIAQILTTGSEVERASTKAELDVAFDRLLASQVRVAAAA